MLLCRRLLCLGFLNFDGFVVGTMWFLRRMRFGGFAGGGGLGVDAVRVCGLIDFVRWVYVLWVSWFGFPD